MTHADDVAMLDRALALENLTTDQRSAFAGMRDVLAANEALVLTPRQRAWVDGVLNRRESIALTALKTILDDLDRLGAKK